MHVGTPEAIAEARRPRIKREQRALIGPARCIACMICARCLPSSSPTSSPSRLGAVPADADRRAARRHGWCPAFRPAAIRSRWRARRSICRPGAPAGWRATCSSTCSTATPRSCRASSPIGDIDEDEIAFAEAATGELAEAALDSAGRARRARAPAAAGRADPEMGESPAMRGARRRAAGRQHSGRRAGARRRSRAADGRHDDAAGAVGQARRPGAGRARRILAAHAALSEDRARALAERPRRARRDRAGRAPRPADRGRGRAARQQRRAGDRRRLDRLDAGDREAARDHRQAAARRGGAARPRHRSRRRDLGADRRRRRRQSHDGAPAAGHPQFAMQALLRRIGITRSDVAQLARPRRMAASCWCRRRCGRRPPPSAGRRGCSDKGFRRRRRRRARHARA